MARRTSIRHCVSAPSVTTTLSPDGIQEFVLREELPAALDQHAQDPERLGPQPDVDPRLEQSAAFQVQAVVAERIADARARHPDVASPREQVLLMFRNFIALLWCLCRYLAPAGNERRRHTPSLQEDRVGTGADVRRLEAASWSRFRRGIEHGKTVVGRGAGPPCGSHSASCRPRGAENPLISRESTMDKTASSIYGFLLLACGTATAPGGWAAPTVWEPAVGGNGHLYQVIRVGTGLTWDNARAAAQALGSGWHLATITSAGENAFVKSLFEADHATFARLVWVCGPEYICWYWWGPWIGGFNVTAPDTFQWVTGEPVSFTAWNTFFLYPQGQQIAYVARWERSPTASPRFDWGRLGSGLDLPIAYIAEYPQPPAVLSLTLTRATVAGCRSVTGTVTLPHSAPSAGLVVNLGETLESATSP